MLLKNMNNSFSYQFIYLRLDCRDLSQRNVLSVSDNIPGSSEKLPLASKEGQRVAYLEAISLTFFL